jgi:formylglycine-generating enzyme required for sulfatase activity
MVWIPGGTFRMGSEEFYVEERPVHEVAVDGF